MPCRTYEDDDCSRVHEDPGLRILNDKLEASLCALLTAVEEKWRLNDFLDEVDFKESGLTRQWLTGWWTSHKEADRIRKVREEAARQEELRRQELRNGALAKLTDAERAELGLK